MIEEELILSNKTVKEVECFTYMNGIVTKKMEEQIKIQHKGLEKHTRLKEYIEE